MKEQKENNSQILQFLKTDGGKTKSNAIEVPSISLPKGGGAIKGIDEKFSVNAVNGTASFSIPLPFSPARGASPNLSLSYNSGSGNSVFGLGWNLGLASIKRKTDKGLPQYFDAIDSDTFLFSEAEDLVPEFQKDEDGSFIMVDGDYVINEKDSTDGLYKIRFYKPRIEGLFARIERWTEKTTDIIKWRVITKDNLTTLFGWTNQAVIADPKDSKKIFEWLPEFVFDDKGNCSHYIYKKEDAEGFDSSLLHNRNRIENSAITYTNLYLNKVLYCNKTPYKNFGIAFPDESEYLFSTVFDYGTLNNTDPVDKINPWDFRTDAFSDYKAGFEIRTTRLCKRVLLFHHFLDNEYNGLVKSTNIEYDTTVQQDFTFLKSITAFGYIKKTDGTYTYKNLPATEFEYQKHDWNKDVKTTSKEDLVHAPSGLDEPQYQFTDLFNEGLSGILTEQANGWYYKHNLGNGKFERAKLVTPKPSFSGLGGQLQLQDLDADGGKQLVSLGSEPKGYFELDEDNEWHRFTNFQNLPNIDFGDPNTRMLDLNGDGLSEILITEDNIFTWYKSEGRNGYTQGQRNIKSFDEEAGPYIAFADSRQTIFLADMSGDGMTDIARIRNGEICYWPNLGYGKFGKKVAMDNAPVFDHPDSFNPSFLRLSDIDGSGTPDIIYLGKNKFTCWMNLSGNRYSTTPFEIDAFPDVHNQAKISVTDLLGNGVACIVWSSSLSKDGYSPLRYIDLMNSKKPHIMISYKNNLGKEVSFEYTPSTKFYIEDKLSGNPWITKLHFPVHCISKTETADKISGWSFVSSYKYHQGYYDHPEREFRGFGLVEQTDSEHFEHWEKEDATNIVDKKLHQEPVVTKSWFHTGAFLRKDKILNQFAHEYWYEEMKRRGFSPDNLETPLPDARLIADPRLLSFSIDHLSPQEWREALRACKSMALRSEVFAHDVPIVNPTSDEIKKQLTPYSVATHNCVIELLQPKGANKHAVFVVKESEAITYSYERNTSDPRIAHTLNIELDEYGNVLESASVVYPRDSDMLDAEIATFPPEFFPDETANAQKSTTIIYTKNQFTNDVTGDDVHRLKLPSEVKTFELKGVKKKKNTAKFYSILDFESVLDNSEEAFYHEIDKEPDDNVPPEDYKPVKRLIEHIRTNYYNNELNAALPLHELESLAIPFESYQLAYTKELLHDIYSGKQTDNELIDLMTEGKFFPSDKVSDKYTKWWIPSGTVNFIDSNDPLDTLAKAQDRFYLPISYTDPYGSTTKVKYGNYLLFIEETIDALQNKSGVDLFNYRTLSPQRMRDMNNNLSEAITDELGLVKAMAVMGKDNNNDGVGEEADDLDLLFEYRTSADDTSVNLFFAANRTFAYDPADDDAKNLLQHATARFVYDFDAYKNTGKPAVVASIVRETHYRKDETTLNPESKLQLSFEYSNGLGKVVMKKVQAEPGWAKQVEVDAANKYKIKDVDTSNNEPKQLRWIGNGRTILNNKGNPVKQYEPYFSVTHLYEDFKELVETGVTPVMYYDAMSRLIKTEMPDGTFSKVEFDSWKQISYDANDTVDESEWYSKRISITDTDDPERKAAMKAYAHRNTPSQLHFDTLGRPVLQVEDNANGILYKTKIELDVEGNLRDVTDARENKVMEYKYDMLGNLVYQKSMDAGQRWLLHNVLGNPLRTWDERDHEFQYEYDLLHRPVSSKVKGGDGIGLNNFFERIIYGESLLIAGGSNRTILEGKNIFGKPIEHYDTGGVVRTPEYDFKGQPKFSTRKLFNDYKSVANWEDPPDQSTLEIDDFTFATETDALGRITKQIAPDGSVIIPSYNEAGLLNSETVIHVSPAPTAVYIKEIDYNEKGQRSRIVYGNDVTTNYFYDKETFRLERLESKRLDNSVLQDLYYTYDPVGNITSIKDDAIPTVFFANAMIAPASEYTYDALYRLVEATGRENNAALTFGDYDNWDDASYMHQLHPGDQMEIRNYTQLYQYDPVGNIKLMSHNAFGNNWTREYEYETNNNRLTSTTVGNSFPYTYLHHERHGFITAMPHLQEMGWNFKEELVKTIRQRVTQVDPTPETTYYQYDGQGQRIRKITENSSTTNVTTKKDERIYISGYETYRTYQADIIDFERESLSLLEEGHRFVMVETVKTPSEREGERLVRYQLHNHLGSAALELDDTAQVISYEEYHPFGTTAYQANNSSIRAAAKRYRYTGMERDEETGLEYYSARYYLPWLGRWCSADPIGIGDGVNVYEYVRGNPLIFHDPDGLQTQPIFNNTTTTGNNSNGELSIRVPPPNTPISFPIDSRVPNSSLRQNFVDFNLAKIPNPGILDLTNPQVTPQQVVNHFLQAARFSIANTNGVLLVSNFFNLNQNTQRYNINNQPVSIEGKNALFTVNLRPQSTFQVLAFTTFTSGVGPNNLAGTTVIGSSGNMGNALQVATQAQNANSVMSTTFLTFNSIGVVGQINIDANNFYSTQSGFGTLQDATGYKIDQIIVGKFNSALEIGEQISKARYMYNLPGPVIPTIPLNFRLGTQK